MAKKGYRPHQRQKMVRSTTVVFDDMEVEVIYRPNVITPEFADRMSNVDQRNSDAVGGVIGDVIADWDVEDEDGNKIKPTDWEKVKKGFELGFLNAVIEKVMTEVAGDPQKGDGSFDS